MNVVAASPYTKLFLAEWEERLLENPDLIFDETMTFSFIVPRPAGAIENVRFGIPINPDECIRGTLQEKESGAAADLRNYLTGGPDGSGMQETDWTGIVEIDTNSQDQRALSEITQIIMLAQGSGDEAAVKKAKAKFEAISSKAFADTQSKIKAARDIANARVVRQLKTTHLNLMRQYQHNKEDGKNIYAPSAIEHFGAYVLRKIVQVSEGRRTMNEKFKQLIQDTMVMQ